MVSLDRVYVEQMRHHPYGLALFHPVSTNTIQPGSVGFFNDLGFWNPIAHLEDLSTLQKHGLKPPREPLERSPPERIIRWTPRTSSRVTQKLLGFSVGAGALATGLPVDASIALEYKTSGNCGAVIISSSPVVRQAYYYQSPFKKWVADNASILLHGRLAEDVKKFGLFVVTQTFATKKCALTAWRNPETKVHFGFGAGVSGLAELSPQVEWYAGSSESGWNFHEADEPDMKVVFAGGLSFKKTLFSRSQLHETQSPTRGAFDPDQSLSVALPDEEVILDCEVWGDINQRYSETQDEDSACSPISDEES